MSWQAAPNPRSMEAGQRIETWLKSLGVLADETSIVTFRALAASGYGGWPFPTSSLDRLETITAFLTLWILLDDRLENGEPVDERLRRAIRGDSPVAPADGFLRAWWHVGRRTRVMGTEWRDRQVDRFEDWLGSVEEERDFVRRYHATQRHPDLQDYLAFRRTNIGVLATTPFIEYSLGRQLPTDVRNHPLLKTIEVLAAEAVIWTNDLYGFTKDLQVGWPNAVQALAAESDLTLPAAFERASALHNLCIQDIFVLEQQLLAATDEPLVRAWLDGLNHMLYGFARWQETAPRYGAVHEVEGREIRLTTRLREVVALTDAIHPRAGSRHHELTGDRL